MKTRQIALAIVCALATLLAGCGVKEKVDTAKQVAEVVVEQVQEVATEVAVEEAKDEEPSEASEPTETPAPKKQEAKPTDTPVTEAEAEEVLPDLKSYDDLKSYRQEMRNSYTVDGELEGEWTIVAEFDKDTPAMRYLMKGMDEDGQTYETENIQIGETMYTRMDDEWMAMEIPDQNILDEMAPWAQHEDWVDDDCKRKGKENIAGESCIHYVCDVDSGVLMAQALADGAGGITNVQGEFWVSTKHQVTIKSIITWEGMEDGKKVEFYYETLITDIDKPINIEKPEGVQAPGAGADIPVYPEAVKTMAMQGMSTYEVEAQVADVAEWYQEELPKAGYALNADESMAPMILSFVKDSQVLQVMLNQDGPKVSIMVMSESQ